MTEPAFSGYEVDNEHPIDSLIDRNKQLEEALKHNKNTIEMLQMLLVGYYGMGFNMSGDTIKKEYWYQEADKALTRIQEITKG